MILEVKCPNCGSRNISATVGRNNYIYFGICLSCEHELSLKERVCMGSSVMSKENYLLDLIGRSKLNAMSKLECDEHIYRITKEDDTNYIITDDLNFDRVNLKIKDGVVVSAKRG